MQNQIEIFKTNDDQTVVQVRFDNDTVWLSQDQLAALFERDQSVISRHLGNVFKEGELIKASNMQKMHIANSDKPIILYSLDVIISPVPCKISSGNTISAMGYKTVKRLPCSRGCNQ